VARRDHDGSFRFAYDHPGLGDNGHELRTAAFDRLSTRTDRPVEAVERTFRRKHGYVEYLVRESRSDVGDLFAFLADLRTDEAATVERVRRRARTASGTGGTAAGGTAGDGQDGMWRDRTREGGRGGGHGDPD
jgi:hypothetical protein